MAGGHEWRAIVLSRFAATFHESYAGFISPFLARISPSSPFYAIIVKTVYFIDTVLLKARILEPEYHFMVLKKK